MSNHDLAYQAPKLSTAPCLLFFFSMRSSALKRNSPVNGCVWRYKSMVNGCKQVGTCFWVKGRFWGIDGIDLGVDSCIL